MKIRLLEIFGKRMGFTDREIVALSGGHTLGRCHAARSGFDGPWTTHPLRFDNEYYKNLLNRTWVPRKWDGPKQFEDEETGKLMMLPSDLALINDPIFKPIVEEYPSI
jgi:catalase (peroxidase I)